MVSAITASWCAVLAAVVHHSPILTSYLTMLPAQILSGDVIEATVGGALRLSTMAAAGCGNMVSDVLGIGISGQIEVCKAPRLSSGRFALTRHCFAPMHSVRAMRWAFAHGSPWPRCSCQLPRVRLRRTASTPSCSAAVLTSNSRARGDNRQPVPWRGFWLHFGNVPSIAWHARRGVGCRGCGGVACSITLSEFDRTSDPTTL